MNKNLLRLILATALIGAGGRADAGDPGHYVGGLMGTRDYFVPPEGFYAAVYNYFYTSDRYNDQNGNRTGSITIDPPGPRPGTTISADVNLDMYVLAPAFIWSSPWKVLGARYAAYITPTFANNNFAGALNLSQGFGGSGSQSSFALGDMFVEPLWLGWSLPHWDVSAGYGFYAPVGKYSTDTIAVPGGSVTVPDSSNVGLGYWTQQFQGAAAWYPMTNRATAVTLALTYNYNSEQQGTDITFGQILWLNWGISQYLPLKKDNSLLLEVGPAGYYEWQISDSTGGLADPDSRTSVSGIGGQIGVTYVPWDLIVNFRGFYEYAAEERVQGASFGINIVKKL
ncbi:MAG: transporter [Verrucomicrobia bacterium]|nr:transporter [Verrucomicrobiota bacterium]